MTLPPPDPWSLVAWWDAGSWAFAAAALGAGLALVAVRRAVAQGRPIGAARVAALAAALAVLAYATAGGVSRYDSASFGAHAVQHLLVGMVGPALLAAAGPMRLTMRAGGSASRVRVARAFGSPVGRVFAHPAFAWCAFVPALYALYFSPLYRWSLHHDVVHALVHVHFLVAGLLFFVHAVGTDPLPRPLGPGGRMLFLASTVPFHAFLGLALLSSRELVGGVPPVAVEGLDLLADQRLGAVVLWAGSELITGVLVLTAAVRWAASDASVAAREDASAARGEGRPAAPLANG